MSTADVLNIACIDGLRVDLLNPVREYFADNGIAVAINDATVAECLYHIVIGTPKEVKDIFSRNIKDAERRLILLIEGNRMNAQELADAYTAKVACIDNKPLSRDKIPVVFGFLFTGSDAVLLMGSSAREQSSSRSATAKKVQEIPPHISWEQDQKRIQSLAKQFFAKNPPAGFGKTWARSARLFVTYALLSYCVLLASHFLAVGIGTALLFRSFNQVNQQQFGGTTKSSAMILHYASDTISFVRWIAFYQPLEVSLRDYERLVENIKKIADVGVSLQQTMGDSVPLKIFFETRKTPEVSPAVFLSQAREVWQKNKAVITQVAADMDVIIATPHFPFSLPVIKANIIQARNLLVRVQQQGDALSRMATLYPFLAGTGEEKSYLLLFQNSMELRPTGGFIGSVGMVTFRDGTIADFSVQDVYQIDGQLRGHVDPPEPLRAILSQEHWYLRDSNWNPDFRVSGQKAAWFYKTSTGKIVDGVIGISLPVMQDILKATGPVTLSDAGLSISSDTLFGALDKEVHTDFFPGSTKKQDLLGELSRRLITAITEGGKTNPLSLAEAITQGLVSHDIVLFSADQATQDRIEEYGWGGEFLSLAPIQNFCLRQESCLFDVFATNEANLAVNKANYYVTRTAERHLSLADSGISGEDVFVIANNSPGDALQGGTYTNYERFYFPDTAQILSVTVNGTSLFVRESTTSATLPYAERIAEKDGFVTIGVGLNVFPGEKSRVSISYTRPYGAFPSAYALFLAKQAGVEEYPVKIVLDAPDSYTFQMISQPLSRGKGTFVAKTGHFEYNTNITQDQTVFVALKKIHE